jgi:hypothetical protein
MPWTPYSSSELAFPSEYLVSQWWYWQTFLFSWESIAWSWSASGGHRTILVLLYCYVFFPLSISAHWWVQLHISPSFKGPDRLNVQQVISNYSVFTCVLHFWVAFVSLFVGVMRLLQICVNKSLITEIWLCVKGCQEWWRQGVSSGKEQSTARCWCNCTYIFWRVGSCCESHLWHAGINAW